jgi:hypothetical protein
MAKQDYYPVKLGDQATWLNNYKDKIVIQGPILGMTAVEITDNVTAAGNQMQAVADAITAENAFKAAIDNRDNAEKVNVTLIRKATKRNKTSPAYTTGIGDILGVEGEEPEFDAASYKPEGSVKAVMNVVTVKFTKKGAYGQVIYSKVTPGVSTLPPTTPGSPSSPATISQFSKIAIDFYSPYIDNRELAVAGQPELREYYLRGLLNDVEIGLPGDVMRVIVGAV